GAARPATRGAPAGVLRPAHPDRDRRAAGRPARHREDQDVPGHATTRRAAGREGRCAVTAPEHVFDELPGLLAGELDRSATGRVAAHLRTCDDCRQDLVLVVSAGAAMRSAVRFAPQVVLEPEEALPDPGGLLTALATDSQPPGGQPVTPREAEPDGSGTETQPDPSTWPIPETRHGAETGRSGTAGPD